MRAAECRRVPAGWSAGRAKNRRVRLTDRTDFGTRSDRRLAIAEVEFFGRR
ncbi:hypothetical protein ABZ769_26610 [Streptomyces olivoreticuli]